VTHLEKEHRVGVVDSTSPRFLMSPSSAEHCYIIAGLNMAFLVNLRSNGLLGCPLYRFGFGLVLSEFIVQIS